MPRLKLKLTNKHLSQVRIVEESENAPFIISRGSRYIIKFGPRRDTMEEIIESEQEKRDPISLILSSLTP